MIGRYWHKTDHGKIQCDLCPHNCKLGQNLGLLIRVELAESGHQRGGSRPDGLGGAEPFRRVLHHALPAIGARDRPGDLHTGREMLRHQSVGELLRGLSGIDRGDSYNFV